MLTTTVAGRTWNFSHAIGRNAAAGNGFTQPVDVAAGPDGILYVLSRGNDGIGGVTAPNKRIGKLTIDQEFIGDFARGILMWPAGLAVDADGNIYCSEEFEHKIYIFNEDGEELGSWGESGSGEGQLKGPSGLAFDSDNNLIVTDAHNNRLQKFTADGQHIATIGEGQLNSPGASASTPTTTSTSPTGAITAPASSLPTATCFSHSGAATWKTAATWTIRPALPLTAKAMSMSQTGATRESRYTRPTALS